MCLLDELIPQAPTSSDWLSLHNTNLTKGQKKIKSNTFKVKAPKGLLRRKTWKHLSPKLESVVVLPQGGHRIGQTTERLGWEEPSSWFQPFQWHFGGLIKDTSTMSACVLDTGPHLSLCLMRALPYHWYYVDSERDTHLRLLRRLSLLCLLLILISS